MDSTQSSSAAVRLKLLVEQQKPPSDGGKFCRLTVRETGRCGSGTNMVVRNWGCTGTGSDVIETLLVNIVGK